jgi:aryl-alcohol dehydrogenase-like predicted oxidoreductase
VIAGTIGSTGIPVTRLGLGLAALGRPGYINVGHGADLGGRIDPHAMEGNAHAVLDAAYAGGIRYFDAARSYGRAEEFLASWLRERSLAPSAVTVGSKWGYTYTAGWRVDAEVHEEKDLSVETLRRQLPETLAHLGPYLRLYQIHSATLESGVLDDQAVLGELDNVRARGIAVGLTVTGPGQRETIERALDLGRFDSVQATWNLLERSAEPALAACHEAGMGVIVKEALANGRLAARGGVPLLADAGRRRRVGPDAVALAVAMAQPWADVVLSGATTVHELESNLVASSLEVDDNLVAELEALREHAGDYWRTRAALPWN